ncbi:MAG: cold shock domain-containing protein [Bacteroidales bacterium]|nr:cold shock domain-containing protein [Bacteroidales bacterium]
MARSQETFGKKEVRNKKEKKRKDKEAKRLAKKETDKKGGGLDDMIAYVDENGMIVDTPPDPTKKKKVKASDIALGVPSREQEDFDPIRKGTVTFFNDSKGFGFIKDIETKESVFVHINNCIDEISEDNLVSFEVEQGPKGLAAVQVKLVK